MHQEACLALSVQQKPFFVAVVALPPFSVELQGSTSFGVSVGGHRWDPIVAAVISYAHLKFLT